MDIDISELANKISSKRIYKLVEAARLVSAVMPAYLFHALVRTKFKAEGNHSSGACRDLTGAELLEIVYRARDHARAGTHLEGQKTDRRSPSGRPNRDVINDAWKAWSRAPTEPPSLVESETESETVIPHWVDRVWELTHRQRECRPSLLDQLSRHQRVFAELPNGKWYIKHQNLLAPSVKPLQGLKYIWDLLTQRRPVETCELIGAWTYSSFEDDEITPYTEFGKSGWSVTRLFDEQKEYDKVCKHFDRAIEVIGKTCPELGRYFQLVIQRPSMNGEGWLVHDHSPGEWVLHATTDGTDAGMYKIGDAWLLRWFDTECKVPNERIGLEYAARIVAESRTGVPCCLLRDSGMADALAAYPDIQSISHIFKKHVQRKDCFPAEGKSGLARVVDVLEHKRAEAFLEGRISDSADLSFASGRVKSLVEYLRTRPRLLSQIDQMNIHGRTQVKKNLDSAIDFLAENGAKEIAEHFAQYVETGEICHYSGALSWDVRGLDRFPCIFRLACDRAFGLT